MVYPCVRYVAHSNIAGHLAKKLSPYSLAVQDTGYHSGAYYENQVRSLARGTRPCDARHCRLRDEHQ